MGNSKVTSTTSRDIAVYVAIAVAFLATAWAISRALGIFTPDPDYAYLLNGLDIVRLQSPTLVDHPGTPVQTLIAIILGITWILTLPWHGFSSVQDQVLLHPEFYMGCVSYAFAACVAAAMVFFAWSVRRSSGILAPALVGLISIFQSYIIYQTFHRTIPETVCWRPRWCLRVSSPRPLTPRMISWGTRRYASIIGILLGFCITAKVTSAPLLLTIFFLPTGKAG